MSVAAEFQSIPVEIFNDFGDLVQAAVLRVNNVTGYSPGGTLITVPSYEYNIRVIEGEITEEQLAAGIANAQDRVFLTPVIELAVVPSNKDAIELGGTVFTVYRAKTDPARALWSIWVRN